MKNWAKNLLLMTCALAAARAVADPLQAVANQRSVLPGGRAALLGGAFTALGDDASGSYYNPAGLSYAKESGFEISATGFRTTRLTYKETVNGEPFEETSQEIYPSFIGGTKRLSALTLGYSFITLDSRNAYQRDRFEGISDEPGTASTYSRTYQESSAYIWAGGSAALALSGTWSIGMSTFYYQRDTEYTTSEIQTLNGGGLRVVDSTLKTLNTGIAGVLGLVYRDKTWSIGASVRQARAISNSSDVVQDVVTYDPTSTSGASVPSASTETSSYEILDELNPPTYSLGLAWFPSTHLLLSADAIMHEGVRSPYKDLGGQDLFTTFNYSAGIELSAGSLSLLGGWFTNNSLYRAPDPDRIGQPTAVDFTGWSGGLGWDVKGVRGQIGITHQDGKGRSQVRSGSADVQTVDAEITTYVVSGKVPL